MITRAYVPGFCFTEVLTSVVILCSYSSKVSDDVRYLTDSAAKAMISIKSKIV